MRKILALVAFFFFVPTTVWADTSFFPPFPVPVPATQGGTGQTSFTTNCLIAAASSSALSCTGSPTISGANITSATIPNAALVGGAPDFTTCGTWTPTDASGASLTLTNNGTAYYCHTNHGDGTHSVFISADVTYPVTADTTVAGLSLPYTPSSALLTALVIGLNTNTLANLTVTTNAAPPKTIFWVGSAQKNNLFFSTERISISGTYQCST